MPRMIGRRRRNIGSVVSVGVAILFACSVDTGDITFQEDDVYYRAGGGGVASTGGSPNLGGTTAGAHDAGAGADSKGEGGSSGDGGAATSGGESTGGTESGGTDAGGMGGMETGECPVVIADRLEPEIDDLEDGDEFILMRGKRNGGWYSYNDETGSQTPPPRLLLLPDMPGAAGSRYSMHTSGSGFILWGAGIGFSLLTPPFPSDDMVPCPYDVSPHRGIRFQIRGTNDDGRVRLQLPTIETQPPMQGGTCDGAACGDHFGVEVPVSSSWEAREVPFAELYQWNADSKLDLTHVLTVEFHVAASVSFDFWVDQLEFY